MKAVMMSIQPKWCELIANGKKTVEVRKTRPKLETPFKCYIYETKKKINPWCNGKGKVIGEFVCDEIEILGRNTTFNAPALYSQSCLTREEYFDYIGDKTTYIWHISDVVIYDEPKALSEFTVKRTKTVFSNEYNIEGIVHYPKKEIVFDKLTRPFQSWGYVYEADT